MTELWNFEHDMMNQGYEVICGVDEAGRGPLAGPVCAAAVILPKDLEIPGLNDSKNLPKRRGKPSTILLQSKLLHTVSLWHRSKKLMRSIFCKQPSLQ